MVSVKSQEGYMVWDMDLCPWSFQSTREQAIQGYLDHWGWLKSDWEGMRRRGEVRCVKVTIIPVERK